MLEVACLVVAVLMSVIAGRRRVAWVMEIARRAHQRRQLEILNVEHSWLQHRLGEAQMWIGQMNERQASALINNIMAELHELQRRFTSELEARR